MRLWIAKLRSYRDEIVSEALLARRGELFPSVDDVIEQIEIIQERRRQETANQEWEHYQQEQERAAAEGLLATENDYAVMNEAMKKLGMSKPEFKSFPTSRPLPGIPQQPKNEQEIRDSKEILRQQTEQLLAMRKKQGTP